jgi:phosphate transport system protein
MEQERLEHMRGIFKGSLLNLKDTLLMMASLTDRNLTMALSAYLERDDHKAQSVETEDNVIDRLEIEIDEMVVTYLATHGPMATECRMAFCASKISPALEGIADQAVSIARRARHLNGLAEVQSGVDILPMGKSVLGMIREAINAFVEVNPDKAAPIVLQDKQVDEVNRDNEKTLHRVMAEQTRNIPAYIHIMFISRALEKCGDYAKQIAEEVHYLYTAQDIRHEKNMAGK